MSLVQRWQELQARPLAFVDPRHLYGCFPEPVEAARIDALAEAPRFHDRLLTLLMARHGLQPLAQVPAPQVEDLPVLLLPPAAFARLPRLCGAIWHGATLGREIRRDTVEYLRKALGPELFALALAHRQWSGAMDLLRQPDDLLAAIDLDGARCVHGWLQRQPPALRDWLRLRLALPLDPAAGTVDPSLVRRVAGLLVPETEPDTQEMSA